MDRPDIPLERCLVNAQVARRLGRSESEVRKIRASDPTFPKTFRLRPGGDPVTDLRELDAWIDQRKLLSAEEDGPSPVAVEAIRKLRAG